MRIIVVENYEEMSKKAAVMIASQIILKPNSVLGLATGDTPLGMYKELIDMYHKKQIDFSEAKSFNLDEYYGLEKNNSQSYHHYMIENFFSHINIDKEKINIPITNENLLFKNKTKKEIPFLFTIFTFVPVLLAISSITA
jgi:glucosamine-6-phosphate deaminase